MRFYRYLSENVTVTEPRILRWLYVLLVFNACAQAIGDIVRWAI